MGCAEWKEQIPKCKSPMNVIFFILNILWSGFGTMLSACVNESPGSFVQCQLIIGICQYFGTILFYIGWFWSIWWGWLIFQKGK